ncbi:hypothetical protein QJS10_CPA06g00161 [Acorus calamus]|uniref:Uncharacterized protein n=1 Tax=Acorus calamus TaxID=4465 RepID=A0AAV9EP25_ACOCL|nr:hypothetical protein QJS10_CPA06g00161 [Acorus calamus]
MAILLHFPTRPPQRLFSVPHLKCEIHHIQPFKTPIHAFSANNKPRSRRKTPVKSNADLCDELREFILSVGLPGDRAPSLKELQIHGSDHDVAESNFLRSDPIVAESFPNQGNGALSNHNIFQVWDSTESSSASLHLKASTFVQNGELDSAEVAPDVEGSDVFDVSEPIYGTSSPSDAVECDRSIGTVKPIQSRSLDDYKLSFKYDASGSEISHILDCDIAASEQVFSRTDYRHPRDDISSLEEQSNDFCDNLTSEHEKELELSQLKQQIEKEKIALDMLQVRADTEIGNVDRLISAKDVELKEIDENLSGMKENEIGHLIVTGYLNFGRQCYGFILGFMRFKAQES